MTATEIREKYKTDEVARLAKEIYERDILPKVESEHKGKQLVMDVLTGGYVIDEDPVQASIRAMSEFPDGVRFGFRIGYRASGRI